MAARFAITSPRHHGDSPLNERFLVEPAVKPASVVVIGASAGALESLHTILEGLSAPFPAAVCVVLHGGPESETPFTPSLRRPGRLPVRLAREGEPLAAGAIFIAPPDRHLLVKEGLLRLTRGPRENLWRPSINVLFRSAAVAYGPSVIAVLLSGAFEDGAAGLAAIRRCGGQVILQLPADARPGERPDPAVGASADHLLPAHGIPAVLEQLLAAPSRPGSGVPRSLHCAARRAETGQRAALTEEEPEVGELTAFTCPECAAPLWARRGAALEFFCLLGHPVSRDALERVLGTQLDASLWAAIRLLEQRANLQNVMADDALHRERLRLAHDDRKRACTSQRHADALRALLLEGAPQSAASGLPSLTHATVASLDSASA